MVPIASLLSEPPKGYIANKSEGKELELELDSDNNLSWKQMLTTPQFYPLWIMFMVPSAAGIMLIGSVGSISKSIGLTAEQVASGIILLSIFNTAGRVIGGIVFDLAGRTGVLTIIFMLQAANMVFFTTITEFVPLMIGISIGAMTYGALFGVFPPITADDYGLKTYGTNFGILYTAWGVSGFFGAVLATMAGSTNNTYFAFAFLLTAITIMGYLIKPVDKNKVFDVV